MERERAQHIVELKKKTTCHGYDEVGHWLKDCPNTKKSEEGRTSKS